MACPLICTVTLLSVLWKLAPPITTHVNANHALVLGSFLRSMNEMRHKESPEEGCVKAGCLPPLGCWPETMKVLVQPVESQCPGMVIPKSTHELGGEVGRRGLGLLVGDLLGRGGGGGGWAEPLKRQAGRLCRQSSCYHRRSGHSLLECLSSSPDPAPNAV